MKELSEFTSQFGLLNFLLVNAGLALYWLLKLEMDRSKCVSEKKLFFISHFISDHYPAFFISLVLVWVGSPLMILEYNIHNRLIIFGLGASGGGGFRMVVQTTLNYLKKKRG